MQRSRLRLPALLLLALALANCSSGAKVSTAQTYFGCCDGSAVVALDENHFVTASDEDSTLRIYERSRTNAPVWQRDFSDFLQVTRKSPETDLEGAARIGEVIYWISSHSRNAEGKEHRNRQRFFATRIVKTTAGFELEPTGKPCLTLLPALLAEPSLKEFKLSDASKRSPDVLDGLNIEGLAATPQGGLLIAFRNPLSAGKALIVPLENPAEVISAQAPKFGAPIVLDLGGRGVRDITLFGDRYFLLAGGAADKGKFNLFEWAGPDHAPTLKNAAFGKLSPEGLTATSITGQLELLCTMDDSNAKMDDCDCKDLSDPAQRRFRVATLRP